jgi:hypothetical protein
LGNIFVTVAFVVVVVVVRAGALALKLSLSAPLAVAVVVVVAAAGLRLTFQNGLHEAPAMLAAQSMLMSMPTSMSCVAAELVKETLRGTKRTALP